MDPWDDVSNCNSWQVATKNEGSEPDNRFQQNVFHQQWKLVRGSSWICSHETIEQEEAGWHTGTQPYPLSTMAFPGRLIVSSGHSLFGPARFHSSMYQLLLKIHNVLVGTTVLHFCLAGHAGAAAASSAAAVGRCSYIVLCFISTGDVLSCILQLAFSPQCSDWI